MIETKSYQVEPTITIGGIKFRRMSNGYIFFESAAINADDVEFTVTKQENNN